MFETSEKNEQARLAALDRLQLMDTPPEPEFNELVEVAAAVCEAPISMVTLIDADRQWFKAVVGLDSHSTSREVAFCSHAIQQTDIMTVEDATLDPRFAQNPLVTGEMGIRFYAGVPVSTSDGHPVGTLCVLDRVPRTLTKTQLTALRVLGRQANARLEMREQRKALETALVQADEARAKMRQYQLELEAANVRLRALATIDPLTGLANRRIFDERLAVEFVIARRKNRALSVLFLDVDNFKQRNDDYGHDAGDVTLQCVARLLLDSVRESDLVVRYGGEEFVLLLPETSECEAMALGSRILETVRQTNFEHLPVTLSGGVADLQDTMEKPKEMLRHADTALYAAKHAGKDRVVGYSLHHSVV